MTKKNANSIDYIFWSDLMARIPDARGFKGGMDFLQKKLQTAWNTMTILSYISRRMKSRGRMQG